MSDSIENKPEKPSTADAEQTETTSPELLETPGGAVLLPTEDPPEADETISDESELSPPTEEFQTASDEAETVQAEEEQA